VLMAGGLILTRTLRNRLKRQQAKRQIIFLILGFALVIGLVFAVFALTSDRYPGRSGGIDESTATAGEFIEAPEESTRDIQAGAAPPLSLGVGGDVTFGLGVADVIKQEGPAYLWSSVAPLFGDCDFTVVNLEGPLCRGEKPNPDQTSLYMRGEASCAAPMGEAGVDAVCLANDHIMDYGANGLEETLSILRNEELGSFGAGSNIRSSEQPLLLENDGGAKVALLSVCDVAPSSYTAGEDTPGISSSDLDHVREMIKSAAQEAHYVVIFVHWGVIGSQDITPRQREIARACVEAGADLVVGSHPHVVQGLEILDGVPVIYSLGNLVFSAESESGKTGIFAACRFNRDGIVGLDIIPLRLEGARPVPLAGEQAEGILRQLSAASPGVELEISPITGTATLRLP
jgi:poly-gamma-glutamate capsule biosynthesis protein CapA/YwtB (metallophosphatase superfamily)